MEGFGIPWENTYNMDEKGCQQGGGRGHCRVKYLMSHGKRVHYKFKSDNLKLVTIIECPAFVFSGKEHSPSWWTVDPAINTYMSPNGWTDDFVGTQWFEESFILQATACNTSGKPILPHIRWPQLAYHRSDS
ncbi:hypothetical protein EDB19DRAFT_1831147 [Suillus lakei]|nr:hypothetical protein EDB19DRAFT_1831147 [Suillus lakei]